MSNTSFLKTIELVQQEDKIASLLLQAIETIDEFIALTQKRIDAIKCK